MRVRQTDMHRARGLVEEMQQAQFCNLVTINTLMKEYIAAGDMSAAKGILCEMQQAEQEIARQEIDTLSRHRGDVRMR